LNISNLFNNCSSLSSLPDISKWDINRPIIMNNIFNGCFSILNVPEMK